MSQELIDAITDMREDDALKITNELLDSGASPLDILNACKAAMDVIGKRFETGEAFIPELILAGEMMTAVSDIIKPRMAEEATSEKLGKIVFGTVEGDIHDIAKDIVVFMLDLNGFDVTDLGVDVPPAKFVETVKETGATIVGLSGFLTLAYDPMKETVAALKEAGLDVKVMIGGGQIDEQIREYTGADAYGRDAMSAVGLAKAWAGA
ncbi:MAG: cobalamin B12-binding domain-containing protein [Ardenticatenaceae bacterium]|nr:cobalamin B12-binding domain-containing protein [Ardenticatenaceae bacterium]MCB8949413.1 cobalamin B12-binding domain-containing protein [Ardenticatenaceae bacterium]